MGQIQDCNLSKEKGQKWSFVSCYCEKMVSLELSVAVCRSLA